LLKLDGTRPRYDAFCRERKELAFLDGVGLQLLWDVHGADVRKVRTGPEVFGLKEQEVQAFTQMKYHAI